MAEAANVRERTFGQWWDTREERVAVPLEKLRRFGLAALERAGASPEDAAFLLNISLDKALQGDDARGMRGFAGTVRAALKGEVDLRPEIRIVREKGATALVDGGPKANTNLVAKAAMDRAIEKARQNGVGWVSARAMAQILTAHVNQAVEAGLVGMVLTQSNPYVAPTGGLQPLLGNGPIAFGIPAGKHDPVILDMSMTQSSASGVLQAAREGQPVPEGCLLDEKGNPTTDAAEFPVREYFQTGVMRVRGTLTPLGSSHKAYAMIFVIGLLTSVLADANPPWEPRTGDDWRYGSIHVAVDPGVFLPPEEFRRRVDAFIDHVKAAPKREGVAEILYPGEGSQRLKRQRRESGTIELPQSHYRDLVALAVDLGLGDALGTGT
jgi:LDH2 family malate/lactate/ureidoglycolate dehydrogenase